MNKVNSKAVLHWSLVATHAISGAVKQRLRLKYGNRISSEGEMVITSHRHRDQPRNSADCLNKLKLMLRAVATPPKPRKKTKVPKGVIRRRLENKKRNADKKRSRSKIDRD